MSLDWEPFFPPNSSVLALPSWQKPKLLIQAGNAAQRWTNSALYPAFRFWAKGFRWGMRIKACVDAAVRKSQSPWMLQPLLEKLGPQWSTTAVLLGTPGPAQKTVLQLSRGGTVQAFAKYGRNEAAQARLQNEFQVLCALPQGLGPKVLAFEAVAGGKVLLLSAEAGQTLSATLHTIDRIQPFLQQFPHNGLFNIAEHPWIKPHLGHPQVAVWLEPLQSQQWPIVPLHGDLAPWNLLNNNGQLKAIDWEYGTTDGLPGIDLAYYVLQVSALVLRYPPQKALGIAIQALTDSPLRPDIHQARSLVYLAALDAQRKALSDGQSPEEPLLQWRRQLWETL